MRLEWFVVDVQRNLRRGLVAGGDVESDGCGGGGGAGGEVRVGGVVVHDICSLTLVFTVWSFANVVNRHHQLRTFLEVCWPGCCLFNGGYRRCL